MKMTIKTACLALFCSCLATVGAETIDIYETWKGQAFGDDDTKYNRFQGFAAGNTYTLSADFTFTNSLGVRNAIWLPNSITFDFSDGAHVLRTGEIVKYGGTGTEIVFKGGTWDVGGGRFTLGGWHNLSYNSVTYRLEGVVVTNLQQGASLVVGYGTNMQFLAKSGTKFYASGDYLNLCPATDAATAAGKPLSRLIEFSGGSKLYAGNGPVYDNRSVVVGRPQNCTIRFTGTGTVAAGNAADESAGGSHFYFGFLAPNYRLEVLDQAQFKFRSFHVGGAIVNDTVSGGNTSCSNSVLVAGGGFMSPTSVVIGEVPGSDHNSFLVDDGGILELSSTEGVSVGSRSSFNSFTVTNGTVTAKTIYVGYNSGASNNVVRLVGDRANVSLTASPYIPFNCGTGNSLILDDGFRMGTASKDLRFTPDGVASTGNLVRVDGGSVLTARYINIANVAGSVDNTFHIGSGATVVANSISMNTGDTTGNTLCISNGTFRYTDGYGLHCGGIGNVCRIAGSAPKVRYDGVSSGVATFRNGVELQYDLTGLSAAYAEPAMLIKWFQMLAGTHLTFRGVEDASKRIPTRTDFVLVRVTDDNHLVLSNVDAGVITEAEASLPDCAKLLVANDGHDLVLRVRSTMPGFSIFVR